MGVTTRALGSAQASTSPDSPLSEKPSPESSSSSSKQVRGCPAPVRRAALPSGDPGRPRGASAGRSGSGWWGRACSRAGCHARVHAPIGPRDGDRIKPAHGLSCTSARSTITGPDTVPTSRRSSMAQRYFVVWARYTALVLTLASGPGPAAAAPAGTDANFAFNLYRRLPRPDQNGLFSPSSLTVALGMASAGARGETASQMTGVLGGSADE